MLRNDEPLAGAVTTAIRNGDLDVLRRLLDQHPELATTSIVDADGTERSLLHVATDWPGHFPNNTEVVDLLVAAGADVNARFQGSHTETPLHWAASSDDVAVLDALLDAGADIDADGAVIAGGTPLTDATTFGQWRAAQRLIGRGARSTLFESAVMGLLDRVTVALASDPAPTASDVDAAFWGACHGGRAGLAEYLLSRGASIDWVARWDGPTPIAAARRNEHPVLVDWLIDHGAEPNHA